MATATSTVLAEVRKERKRQDVKWGGPAHDDGHTPYDWAAFVMEHARWSVGEENLEMTGAFRREMLQVAALAVAAIEAYDRWRRRMEACSNAGE